MTEQPAVPRIVQLHEHDLDVLSQRQKLARTSDQERMLVMALRTFLRGLGSGVWVGQGRTVKVSSGPSRS